MLLAVSQARAVLWQLMDNLAGCCETHPKACDRAYRRNVCAVISGTDTTLNLISSQDTTEQNAICTAVRVSGKGKPPMLGSRMYLLYLRVQAQHPTPFKHMMHQRCQHSYQPASATPLTAARHMQLGQTWFASFCWTASDDVQRSDFCHNSLHDDSRAERYPQRHASESSTVGQGWCEVCTVEQCCLIWVSSCVISYP